MDKLNAAVSDKIGTNATRPWSLRMNQPPVYYPLSPVYVICKRGIDILVSVTVLVVGFPVYLVLGLITYATSPGPIFYRQERIGKGGIPFLIYKFRSMYTDAEAAGPRLSTGPLDERITRWGWVMRKRRLDELPQFFNVLKGDMTLVGPRPERQFYIDQLMRRVPAYSALLHVKPGITSLGQVRYGYAATIDEMVQRVGIDLIYLKRQSIAYDLWIVLLTIGIMIKGLGR